MLGKLNFYVVRVSIFLITIALIVGIAGCVYYPPSENLEIRTWYDLDAVRNNLAGNHTLMNDLDSTSRGYEELASPTANEGYGWDPIGVPGVSPVISFLGEFDGQGYKICDLYTDGGLSAGLFGFVDYGGVIKDVGVMNVTAIGYRTAGSLVGENRGTVSNSFWDVRTSGQATSDGGTGKTTTEMQDISTFSDAGWKITAVANSGTPTPSYIWNTVDGETYPFLSWQPVS